MANAEAFFGFILYYSALLGPILGVMLADYYFIRRRELNVRQLYVADATSEYWYRGGFNVAGLLAILIPGIATMIWWLPMSWLIGVPAGFLLYLLLWRSPISRAAASPA